MFQFGRFPTHTYFVQYALARSSRAGFPHSEICGYCAYVPLPAAYRSLSRPSSAPDAKAFPLRPFVLDLFLFLNYAGSTSRSTSRKQKFLKLLAALHSGDVMLTHRRVAYPLFSTILLFCCLAFFVFIQFSRCSASPSETLSPSEPDIICENALRPLN